MTRIYVAALGAVALLAVSSHVVTERMLADQAGMAGAINVSGRQRMLSQRIAGYTLALVSAAADPEIARAGLVAATDRFESGHRALIGETPGLVSEPLPDAVAAYYFGPTDILDWRSRRFVEAARTVAAAPRPQADDPAVRLVLDQAHADLLQRLDAAVGALEAHAEAETTALRRLQWWLLGILLLTLALEARLVFRPLVRAVVDRQRGLERARAQLEGVLNNLSEAVLVVDDTLTVRQSNGAAGALWGADGADLTGRALDTLVDIEQLGAAPIEALRDAERNHTSQLLRAHHADGTSFPFEMRAGQVASEAGMHIIISGRDVTERRRNEQRLRVYQTAVMSATDPMVVCRRDAGDEVPDAIEIVNAAFVEAMEMSWSEARELRFRDLVSPDADAKVKEALRVAFTASEMARIELPLCTADEHEFWAELAVMPTSEPGEPVDAVVGLFRDVTERRRLAAATHARAHVDSVTGLANRWSFEDQLSVAVDEARDHGRPSTLMFIDLDGFKQVNDQLGHDAGDALLRIVGQRLSELVRGDDFVARLGGDEFAVIFKDVDTHQSQDLATRLLEGVQAPVDLDGEVAHVGASIGVAMCPSHTGDATTLLRLADQAMYEAKAGGKNRWVFSKPELAAQPQAVLQG